MNELLPEGLTAIDLLPVLAVAVILAAYLVYRRRGRRRTLKGVLNRIAFERIDGLIIPKADEGEIQIDYLVLTAQGLLVIDIKDVTGTVFGSDKMEQWTVMGKDNRFTFSNPQHALFDRIAAVRQIVRQVPVSGRIVFLDGATFTKGVPDLVCNLDELQSQFEDSDQDAARVKIEAFIPHWERIKSRAEQ